jgi:polyferredoxin
MTTTTAPADMKAGTIRRTARHVKDTWETKTYKREIAIVLLLIWLLLTMLSAGRFLLFYPEPPVMQAMAAAWGPIYSTMTTTILTFAGWVFSLDAYAKQIAARGT